LLSAGLGAIFGSIAWGRAGDKFGRKGPLVAAIATFSVATGLLALVPQDGWALMSMIRFIVGAGEPAPL